jgi:hypothetical protein
VAIAGARWLGRARLPEDYDQVGFVRAVEHYDLAALQPHFPGYPVYVALTKLAHALGLAPLCAATAVSAIASGATGWALWRIARALGGPRAGFIAIGLWSVAWLPALLGGAALSDATATALIALGFAALTCDGRAAAAGGAALLALALGVRASDWPFALSFALTIASTRRAEMGAALAGAAAGLVSWLVPFCAFVGGRSLLALGRTHLTGHFAEWGGSIVTRPDLGERAFAFVRALVYDGLFAQPWALALAPVVLLAGFRWERGQSGRRAIAPVLLLAAAPYGLWAFFAQNVIDQPRHLLPVVAAVTVAIAAKLGERPRTGAALCALGLAATLPLALSRVRVPPAAAQAAAYVQARWPERNQAIVFGSRSMRLFSWVAPALLTRTRGWLSEVDVDLQRVDVLPSVVLVTDELTGDAARARRLREVARFCRDPRIDRQQPCLNLREYELGIGRQR